MRRLALLLALLLAAVPLGGQSYTIMPSPFQVVWDLNGLIVNAGCVWSYSAGTTTPVNTYADTLGTVNGNPIIAGSDGKFTAYLVSGLSYKFVYETVPCSASAHGPVIRTQDQIQAVPASSATVAVTGTAGVSLAAGSVVYLSDGSGSLTAGAWYLADPSQPYSSMLPVLGIAQASIGAGLTGAITTSGEIPGLTALTPGSDYFVSTAGTLTTTAPALTRYLGRADTATSLNFQPNPPAPRSTDLVDEFRLSLTTATCVTTADVTGASAMTLYFTPCGGNRLTLFTSAGVPYTVITPEIAASVPSTTAQMYDVFAYWSAGVVALELDPWTNDTTPTIAITRTNGAWVKATDPTRLYVSSFRTTTVSGQTEDSLLRRYLCNQYNAVATPVRVTEASPSWTYQTPTWRQANANAADQVDVVQCHTAEHALALTLTGSAFGTTAAWANLGIGLDSTTTPVAGATGGILLLASTSMTQQFIAPLVTVPPMGRHVFPWLEAGQGGGTTTWFGTNATVGGDTQVSQLQGTWWR